MEIEGYDCSRNCLTEGDEGGSAPVRGSNEGDVAVTEAEFATSTPSWGSTGGM